MLSIAQTLAPTACSSPVRPLAILVTPTPCRDLVDSVSLQPDFSRTEQIARYSSNLLIHLGLSDLPNIVGLGANLVPLPPALAWMVTTSNLVNTLTGIPAILADVRETRGVMKNPLSTPMDRAMDWTHFLAGDVLSTLGSLTPFLVPLNGPLALGIFVGSQLTGIALDLVKTGYDYHRKGQQSAYREAEQALANRPQDIPA